MCYKYATPTLDELIEHIDKQPKYSAEEYLQYYLADGFDNPYMPITTTEDIGSIEKGQWGLIPYWAKSKPIEEVKAIASRNLNARDDNLYVSNNFKRYIGSKRCLIWTNGFFESQHEQPGKKNTKKFPYFIYRNDKKPFAFGGVYSQWTNQETGEIVKSFAIITTPPNKLLAEIHNSALRMPFIVPEDQTESWLSDLKDDDIKSLVKTFPDGILNAHTVGKLTNARVSSYEKNVPEVQEEFIYPKDTLF